ncbi:MAG: hypothetical protein QXP60_09585 [Nitrososphaerota archaeon]
MYKKRLVYLIIIIISIFLLSFILKIFQFNLFQKYSTFPNTFSLDESFLIALNSTKVVEKIFTKRSGIMIPIRIAPSQYKILIINITLINLNSEKKFFDPFKYIAILKINGKDYYGHYFTHDWFSLLGFIDSNKKVEGHIVFLIPKNITSAEFIIRYSWKNENKNICDIFLKIDY